MIFLGIKSVDTYDFNKYLFELYESGTIKVCEIKTGNSFLSRVSNWLTYDVNGAICHAYDGCHCGTAVVLNLSLSFHFFIFYVTASKFK